MEVKFSDKSVTVQRMAGDPRAATESHFYFQLRNALNGQHDAPVRSVNARWRTVRPDHTDGCLTGMPYALAVGRDWRKLISDGLYAIRSAAEDYNAGRAVRLDYAAEVQPCAS